MIEAGGEDWAVEAHEPESSRPAGERSWFALTFRSATNPRGDRVEMGWIPGPARVTRRLARRLFELAGERVWKDSRTGRVHRVHLVDEGTASGAGDLRIRFRWAGGEARTRYRCRRPLGLLTRQEMQGMLDEAVGSPSPA